MIVIVASRWNKATRTLASRWSSQEVGVLVPRDLSVAGWRQQLSTPDCGSIVVEGKVLAQSEITGVLTLLPCVSEQDLPHIVPADRSFVASEMNAFLLFWLSSLQCPVLNRPTPMCLSGPSWSKEYWVHRAAQAGLPVRPVHRCSSAAKPDICSPAATVTVVGKHTFGEAAPQLHHYARCLADAANVQLLSVQFSAPSDDAQLIGADLFPDLADDVLADAIMEHLRG
jgi:hypothetical protein